MEDIKKSLGYLETIELQILGGLHKMKQGNKNEGEHDIEKVARKCKANCKSMEIKLQSVQKQMKVLKDENEKLREENKHVKSEKIKLEKELQTLKEEKTKIEVDFNKSQTIMTSFFSNCLEDESFDKDLSNHSTDESDACEANGEGKLQSQDIFHTPSKKVRKE